MSFSLWTVACEGIRKSKSPTRMMRARLGCIRNPRAVRCSGCAPAEPYPPNRTESGTQRWLAVINDTCNREQT